jgi:hypothetical protein
MALYTKSKIMEQIDPKIIEKIQKLLNLKEGAEAVGNLHEAENAAARVQDYLLRYNLDLETVKKSKIEQKAEMESITINCSDKQDKRESNWVPKLYVAIATNNLCKIFTYDQQVRILGHKVNVQMVAYIAEQMIAKIRIAEKFTWKEYENSPLEPWGEREKRGTFRRGFFEGAAYGNCCKVKKAERGNDSGI